jgi:hypothetical protein
MFIRTPHKPKRATPLTPLKPTESRSPSQTMSVSHHFQARQKKTQHNMKTTTTSQNIHGAGESLGSLPIVGLKQAAVLPYPKPFTQFQRTNNNCLAVRPLHHLLPLRPTRPKILEGNLRTQCKKMAQGKTNRPQQCRVKASKVLEK